MTDGKEDKEETKMNDWHRIFGLTVTEHFEGTLYRVELEKDLSLKQQFLDVVIIEKGEGEPPSEFPDGLENMAAHNLMTYKSHQESLDDWAIDELIGHYVNYRKQSSPSLKKLLPAEDFRLYAVSTRYPEKLFGQVTPVQIGEGVYEARWAVRPVRIIVLSRIPKAERNVLWLLFSTDPEKVGYGAEHYRQSGEMSTLINDLFKKYHTEGIVMPYTIEDYRKDYVREHMHKLPLAERLKGITPDELFREFPPDELFKGLPPEERLRGLPVADRIKGLSPEDIFKELSEEDRRKAAEIIMKQGKQKSSGN
jgi:hypothetical protein